MPTNPKTPDQLDTGTGGINIDGDLYGYDVGVPDADGGKQGKWSPGNVRVDQNQKDLSKPTRETLGNFAGKVTSGKEGSAKVPNKYPVDEKTQTDVSTSDKKGFPSKLNKSTNEKQFKETLQSSRSDAAINLKLNRGKSSEKNQDGNELLSGASEKTSPVVSYTSDVLKTNRFSPDKQLNGVPVLKKGTVKGSSVSGEEVSLGRLAQVGATLSMRATLELNSTSPEFDPSSTAASAGALLPGAAQAGVSRVNQVLLTAKDVLDNLTTEESTNLIDPMSLSWGTMNNVDDQYSGLSAIGMVALSTALVATLQLSIEAISFVFALGQSPKKHPTKDKIGRYSLGHFYYGEKTKDPGIIGAVTAVASLDLGSLLGITPTNVTFTEALKKGSRAFFGVDDSAGVLNGVVSGFVSTVQNPGFNAVVARTIIRSAVMLTDKIKHIGGNPIDASKQIIGLVEVIRTSKIIAACNVFAQLGDAILTESNPDRAATAFASVDNIPDSLYGAAGKSRLNGTLKLAWSQDRTNSMLLLPKNIGSIVAASKNLGVFNQHSNFNSSLGLTKSSQGNDSGRIDPDIVAEQEKLLDSEYVPFYFHDLRTNEIVSFHAFLSSLTDDYNANYETSEAYGRVEAIKIYKSTNRRIGLSFYVAATSIGDFDSMWLKINKLITMLYPQYTQGKLITDGSGYVVRQPFSQMIGASPMIRLRLGDLFKTNYSRFNLARLFGLSDPNLTINNQKLSQDDVSDKLLLFNKTIASDKIPYASDGPYANPSGLTFIPANGVTYPLYDDTTGGVAAQFAATIPFGGVIANKPNVAHTFFQDSNNFMIKGIKKYNDDSVVGEVAINEENSSVNVADLNSRYGENSPFPKMKFIGQRYIFPVSALQLTLKTKQQYYEKIVGVTSDDFATELSNFLSTDVNNGNAIAKSFKSVGGKGLAGFIESINFDWYDNVTWEIDADKVAPKMCKITMQFSPVHDISPGLDHTGYNRAPIYPVGLSAQTPEPKK